MVSPLMSRLTSFSLTPGISTVSWYAVSVALRSTLGLSRPDSPNTSNGRMAAGKGRSKPRKKLSKMRSMSRWTCNMGA